MPPKFKRMVDTTDFRTAHDVERQGLLEDNSDEEDFFLRGPSAHPKRLLQADGKISRVQGQVDEVVGVMQDNIAKVMDRGDRLEDLQDKSDSLVSHADRFKAQSRSLRTHMWWRECKMRILLAVVIIIVIIIIIVPIIIQHRK